MNDASTATNPIQELGYLGADVAIKASRIAAQLTDHIARLTREVQAHEETIDELRAAAAIASEPADPKARAPHHVRVHWHKPFHAPDCDVTHPPACDALPYGTPCWFDVLAREAAENDALGRWPDIGWYVATAPGPGESEIQFTCDPDHGEPRAASVHPHP